MNILDQGTFILVTDSGKALLLENITDAQDPHFEVRRKEEQENPSDREQSANRPGRKQDTGVGQRSALDDTDWHELAKERFADDIADLLYERAHRGKLGPVIIVASPQLLGDLRPKLHKEVQELIQGEIPKTLTNHPITEIERIVKDELAA